MKISLILWLQSRQLHTDLDRRMLSLPLVIGQRGRGLSLPSRLPGDLFSIRLSRARDTGKSRRRLASSTMPPLRPSLVYYRRPFFSAIEPRQCEQWPRRSGVTHACLISSPIKEPVMFYKQLCATRRTPTPLSKHSERPRHAGVPRRWGKSRAALRLPRDGTGKLLSAAGCSFFLGTEDRRDLYHRMLWKLASLIGYRAISLFAFSYFLNILLFVIGSGQFNLAKLESLV